MPYSDAELMKRVADGENAAVRVLHDRFETLVLRMATKCVSPSRADDTVQRVLIRLWRTADRYDPETSALVTWVMMLTRRECIDELRRIKRAAWRSDGNGGPDEAFEAPAARSESWFETRERIEAALAELSEAEQTVIELRLLNLSFNEIEVFCREPAGTLMARHFRAIRKLRKSLGGEQESGTMNGSGEKPEEEKEAGEESSAGAQESA